MCRNKLSLHRIDSTSTTSAITMATARTTTQLADLSKPSSRTTLHRATCTRNLSQQIRSGKFPQSHLFYVIYIYSHNKSLDTKSQDYTCLDTCHNANIPQYNRLQLTPTHSRKTLQPTAKARDSLIHVKKSTTYNLHYMSSSLCTYPVKQMSNSRHSHEAERMDTDDSISSAHKRSATSDPDHRKNKGTKTVHGYEP
jgi:hypothetical protein